MLINLSDIATTPTSQLISVNNSIDEFLFKESGEPFAKSYEKDPKHFRQILAGLLAFKGDVMKYFSNQYADRTKLVNYGDDYTNDDSLWEGYTTTLGGIIEKHTSIFFDLGVATVLVAAAADYSSATPDVQQKLTLESLKQAGIINETTKKRIEAQIQATMDLKEEKELFDLRLKKVFINPYRGQFIAQNGALQAYQDAKYGYAQETNLGYKTWEGSQPDSTEICGEVIGETVRVGEPFSNGLMGPLAHLGCKCDTYYHNNPD